MRRRLRGWLEVGSVARPCSIIMMAHSNHSRNLIIIIIIIIIIIVDCDRRHHYHQSQLTRKQ